jgi:hypothetical protein
VLFYVLFVCKCVLPPADNPIAVNKYTISYHISYLSYIQHKLYTKILVEFISSVSFLEVKGKMKKTVNRALFELQLSACAE